MQFTAPLPFADALQTLRKRNLLPTDAGSADISTWDADLKLRSTLSARTNHAGYLQDTADSLDDLLNGEVTTATLRMELQGMLARYDYKPEAGGFPGLESPNIPSAEVGSLQDLGSDQRLELMLRTQASQVSNYAFRESGQSDEALFAFPCLELVRFTPKELERGTRRGPGGAIVPDPGKDWPARWQAAGGEFYGDGRMIARKDADVWNQLGNPELFPDGLGQPFPPFAFSSGMGVREVPRDESIELGVIDDSDEIEGSTREMNAGMELAADFDPAFLDALKADLDVYLSDGKARLGGVAK